MSRLLTSLALVAAIAVRNGHAQPAAGREPLLRAVATALRENPRETAYLTAWYVDAADTAVAALALAAGAPSHLGTASDRPPNCPWASARTDSSAVGYAVTLRWLRVSPDSARLALAFRCTNPPGYLHRVYWLEYTYRLNRGDAGWVARVDGIGVTAIPHALPNERWSWHGRYGGTAFTAASHDMSLQLNFGRRMAERIAWA